VKKLVFTHLFLNLYLLALIQPALPIIEYFVNYDYIASELCENKDKPILTCNGKCYLEKQVEEQVNLLQHKEHAPQLPKIDLSTFPLFVLFSTNYQNIQLFKSIKEKLYFNPIETVQNNILSIFIPPQ